MKKPILITIMLLAIGAKAQTSVYHPFPESNAVWNVARQFPFFCGSKPHVEVFSYTFSGDTNINGKTYHKIIIPYVQSMDSCYVLDTTTGYAGCINQDTAARKVYYIAPNHTTPQILYDFSLGVGGKYVTDPLSGLCYLGQDSIISIDSVLIGSDYRKRWHGWGDISSYIEGIGFTEGLLQPCSLTDGPYYGLVCFSQNGSTIYPNADSACNIILSIKDVQEPKIYVSISPNPFHTRTELKINAYEMRGKNLCLQIYDVMGRQLLQQAISSQSTTLERNLLSDGIYIYRVRDEKEEVAMGKFVIN